VRLTGGVATLLKKNGVKVITGRAAIVDGKTDEVAPVGGRRRRIHPRPPDAG